MLLVSENEWHLRADFGCPPPYGLDQPRYGYAIDSDTTPEATRSTTLIRGLPKMRNYLRKLHFTNLCILTQLTLWSYTLQTNTSVRDLRFDATRPSTSFAAYQKCGSTSASYTSRQTMAGMDRRSKRYITGNRVKNRGSTVSRLPLSPSTSFLIFFPAHLL